MKEPFLTDPKQIKAWLDSVGVSGYTIYSDGVVDVKGYVNLDRKLSSLSQLPVRFGKVGGNFYCRDNRLTSLEGGPSEVGRDFICYNNQLTSLEGCPSKVGGDFVCYDNQLTSLEGGPSEVGRGFWCSNNRLTSLKKEEFLSDPKQMDESK